VEPLVHFQRPDKGALFVVTGASGTGKTTLVKEAFRVLPELKFSISATTRAPRAGETDGVEYHFLSVDDFQIMKRKGEFLEWAEVYGNFYGTPRAPIEEAISRGQSILLEIDVQGARSIRERFPDSVQIFVLPPDLGAIERRLRNRSTDSEEIIQGRVDEAMVQISACGEFDYLVVNDDLKTAHVIFQSVLIGALCSRKRRDSLVRQMSKGNEPSK